MQRLRKLLKNLHLRMANQKYDISIQKNTEMIRYVLYHCIYVMMYVRRYVPLKCLCHTVCINKMILFLPLYLDGK